MKYLLLLLLLASCGFEPVDLYSGYISGESHGDTIRLASLKSQASAISTLTYRGVEYIDPTNHGASMQTAWTYDNLGESYNPTEAGSTYDGPEILSSSSVLLKMMAFENTMVAFTNPAYWEAVDGNLRGQERIEKKIVIGYNGLSNVIQYDVNIFVPEFHTLIYVEALTGYMPINFTNYYGYDMVLKQLYLSQDESVNYDELHVKSGDAVITSTSDKLNALAVLSLTDNADTYSKKDSGFYSEYPSNKWDMFFTENNATPGLYHYRMLLVIGTLDEVVASLNAL